MILTPNEKKVMQSFTTTAKTASITCPADMSETVFRETVFSLEEKKLVVSTTNLGKRVILLTEHGRDYLASGLKMDLLNTIKDWAPIATVGLLLLNIILTLLT